MICTALWWTYHNTKRGTITNTSVNQPKIFSIVYNATLESYQLQALQLFLESRFQLAIMDLVKANYMPGND